VLTLRHGVHLLSFSLSLPVSLALSQSRCLVSVGCVCFSLSLSLAGACWIGLSLSLILSLSLSLSLYHFKSWQFRSSCIGSAGVYVSVTRSWLWSIWRVQSCLFDTRVRKWERVYVSWCVCVLVYVSPPSSVEQIQSVSSRTEPKRDIFV